LISPPWASHVALKEKAMLRRYAVMTAACLEIAAGAALLTAPGVACWLLFATKPESVGITLGRFAGVSLIALGLSCLPSKDAGLRRNALFGLLVFNLGVAILFAWVGVVTPLHGVLLWPAVVLHAIIAAALMLSF
jgi:hypothetical protein